MEIAITVLFALPFGALCVMATLYLYRRNDREQRRHLHELTKDYDSQWQEFDMEHKKSFEGAYWSTVTNQRGGVEDGG